MEEIKRNKSRIYKRIAIFALTYTRKGNYETEVLKSDKLVLIDFYADWCGPCKMMSPIIDEIAEEVGDKIKVGKINVDENQELAMEYEVMSIPTIIILQNGEVKNSFVGVREKEEIISCLEKMI